MKHCLRKPKHLRFKIYSTIIIVWICLSCATLNAHASLGGYEIQDLYRSITENVQESNALLSKAFEFTQISPYDVVNSIYGTADGGVVNCIRSATKTMALIIVTLLLMVEFVRKSINFEWASKWENILIFLLKIIIAKQLVQNADTIVGYIYAAFQSINDAATQHGTDFIPCGNVVHYNITVAYTGDTLFEWFASKIWHVDIPYDYAISQDAVTMFYPDADFPAAGTYAVSDYPFASPVDTPTFCPIVEEFILQPYFIILKAIAILIFVITIGRIFELAVYTIFAPLPLSTLASDTSHEVAKNFIKNYIATVIQIAVIVVMFLVYIALCTYFKNNDVTDGFLSIKLIHYVTLISLGLGVMKSGAWAKKICGIG